MTLEDKLLIILNKALIAVGALFLFAKILRAVN